VITEVQFHLKPSNSRTHIEPNPNFLHCEELEQNRTLVVMILSHLYYVSERPRSSERAGGRRRPRHALSSLPFGVSPAAATTNISRYARQSVGQLFSQAASLNSLRSDRRDTPDYIHCFHRTAVLMLPICRLTETKKHVSVH